MGRKKLPVTPVAQIKSALRRLWLRSRERSAALKRDHYTCQECNKKQKKGEVKVEVDHKWLIRWAEIIKYIRQELLVDPLYLQVLCTDCHDQKTKGQRKKETI